MSKAINTRRCRLVSPAMGIVAMLAAAYIVGFAERQAPATLAEPMAHHYDLNDSELGGLFGYGFGLFYALLAVPAGWLADRAKRLRLLALGLALSSLATMMIVRGTSLEAVVALRLIMGIGQSVLVPAAYSLLGDVVPRGHIGRAIALLAVAPFLGAGLMLIFGGSLASDEQWPTVFLVVGTIGLTIGCGCAFPREPTRSRPIDAGHQSSGVALYLKEHWKSVLATDLAIAFAAMAAHSLLAWGAVWLIRSHAMQAADAASYLGYAVLAGGIGGAILAGVGGDALSRGRFRMSRLTLLSGAMVAAAAVALLMFSTSSAVLALACLPILVGLIASSLTLGPAALQDMTPPGLRGRQHGVTVLIVNWLGLGMGPLLVGIATDLSGDPAAIGGVMAVALPIMLGLSAAIAALARTADGQAKAPALPSSTV